MSVCQLPVSEGEVKVKRFSSSSVRLRVEGEDALVVAAHQEDGRQILGQHLQPGHIQSTGHGSLPGQRQAPEDEERTKRR